MLPRINGGLFIPVYLFTIRINISWYIRGETSRRDLFVVVRSCGLERNGEARCFRFLITLNLLARNSLPRYYETFFARLLKKETNEKGEREGARGGQR